MEALSWALLISGLVTLAICTYRFVWLERYRFNDGLGADAVRLTGRVMGTDRKVVYCLDEDGGQLTARPFILAARGDRRHLVIPDGSVLDVRASRHRSAGRVRGVMVGDQVTVDGSTTTRTRDETLYREPGRIDAVEAVRIVGGSWPELRWLQVPLFAAVLIFMFSTGQILFSPSSPGPLQGDAVTLGSHDVTFGRGGAGYDHAHPDDLEPGVVMGYEPDQVMNRRARITMSGSLIAAEDPFRR